MEHNIIHHTTESAPVREPLTVEEADRLIEHVAVEFDLFDWQKEFMRQALTRERPVFLVDGRSTTKTRMHQALARIEEARTDGLA